MFYTKEGSKEATRLKAVLGSTMVNTFLKAILVVTLVASLPTNASAEATESEKGATILIEYQEVYGTDDPNILIDQSKFKKFILSTVGTLKIKEIENGEEEIIDSNLSSEESNKVRKLSDGLLKIPKDNPWSKDYLWDDVKTYTVANIRVGYQENPDSNINSPVFNHELSIVIKTRNSDLLVKKVEDLPDDVIALRNLLKSKEAKLAWNNSKGDQ